MNKILILLPNNLGDVIMTLPVLLGLKTIYPDCHITFFVEKGFEGALINSNLCDKIVFFHRKQVKELIKSGSISESLGCLKATINDLQSENFDTIINLCQHPYLSYLISTFDTAKVRGQHFLRSGNHAISDDWSCYLYAIPFARRFNGLHATDVYKRIAGVGSVRALSKITILQAEYDYVSDFLKKYTNKSSFAILQPGTAYDSKRWPLEHFVALGKMLVNDGFHLLITGSESERSLAEGIKTQIGNDCTITSGELSFRETIVLLTFSDVIVTADTALMHAAASLNRKVYALFGPTNPVETGPYSLGNIVFAGRCVKRPCFCFECKSKLCMKSIAPENVFSYIKERPQETPSCDVYRTTVDINGDFQLIPIYQEGVSYFSRTGASVTRRIFEPEFQLFQNSEEFQQILDACKCFCIKLSEMESLLSSFLQNNDVKYIRLFEETRSQLAVNAGISDFLTAVLNLKLNSVSLIDPADGVRKSIGVCLHFRNQIKIALSDVL
jgi:ADP-heptose:LPS heptosyltransferase